MNFLVTEGYAEAAKNFKIESGIEFGMDIEMVMDRMAVRKAIQFGDVEDAIKKVFGLNPKMLDTNPKLYFHLQLQRLIELIRDGKVEEALQFAHLELAPRVEKNGSFLDDLEGPIALLAFEDVNNCPYKESLDVSRRLQISSEVNVAILASQGYEKEAKLHTLLKMLIWFQYLLEEEAIYPHITDLCTAKLEDPVI